MSASILLAVRGILPRIYCGLTRWAETAALTSRPPSRPATCRPERAECPRSPSERPAKILEAVQTFFDHVKARRVTEPNGTIIAEGSTRHDGDIGFAQQTVSEILRRESKLADVYQDIKRALRFDRGDVGDLRNAVKHVVATHLEFLAHIGERLLIAFERRKRAVLRKGARVRTGMALD